MHIIDSDLPQLGVHPALLLDDDPVAVAVVVLGTDLGIIRHALARCGKRRGRRFEEEERLRCVRGGEGAHLRVVNLSDNSAHPRIHSSDRHLPMKRTYENTLGDSHPSAHTRTHAHTYESEAREYYLVAGPE